MENNTSCPVRAGGELLSQVVEKYTPVSSRDSSRTSSTTTSQATSSATSRSACHNGKRKRKSSSNSDDNDNSDSGSNDTVVASSNEARRRAAASPIKQVETDSTPSSKLNAGALAPTPDKATNQLNSGAENKSVSGTKTAAPPKVKNPPPFHLLKGSYFVKNSADCTLLHINYSKAMRVAEDKIKITVPDVETFHSLNKYQIDNKVQLHTYALDDERFPIFAVYRKIRRDGSSTGLVLAVLPKTEEARAISHNLSKVCGLSGIRVEAPLKRGVPSQCHCCQRECPLSKDSGDKPACINCGQEHTANYGECPKAPKVVPKPTNRTNKKLFNNKKTPPVKDTLNFPALGAKNSLKIFDDGFVPAPMPCSNPWVKKQLSRAESVPSRETNRRGPPGPASLRQSTTEANTFADDSQTSQYRFNVQRTRVPYPTAGRPKPKNLTLLSLNAPGLTNNMLELGQCTKEYEIDIVLVQETLLKPNRPKSYTLAKYA
ncbi:hypothetical protein EVAR_69093_1 [Eumeta japonica]|uniref:Nucleic-acid-binding protein from transposon X-element n=1 Tax=Eumeta variegata TaxID=151549 RepID=A0A4C1ZHG6_EUMVA|nr:hypothetical protein EVAR_69093_1 [Eumeta japonica]